MICIPLKAKITGWYRGNINFSCQGFEPPAYGWWLNMSPIRQSCRY